VRQLQRIAGLPESGAVDRQTWNRLAALINSLPLRI
jgi:peptidoglycan hydrolase-like protein with peptidoglycan-binding domain